MQKGGWLMGWELRGTKRFYYRKTRVDGHVRSVYMGRGERAIAASLADGLPVPQELDEVGRKKDVAQSAHMAEIRQVKKEVAQPGVTQKCEVKKEPDVTSDKPAWLVRLRSLTAHGDATMQDIP
jgi:hypothetical protein